MMNSPYVMLALANDHHQEMIARADRSRLLSGARRAVRARKARAVRGQPAGTLAPCGPTAVVRAR